MSVHYVHVDAVRSGTRSLCHLIAQMGERRRGSTERASLHCPSRLALELVVTADQVVGRTVMAELGLGLALELGDDALSQNLAEFDAPLIERIDVPNGALGEHAVLVERNQLSQRRRGQSVHQVAVGGLI